MKELDGLEIIAAMLVKYPAIIDTLKKVKIVWQHSFCVVLSLASLCKCHMVHNIIGAKCVTRYL